MELRRLTREDWSWVQEWFQDEELDDELGPLDEEWLDYVLEQQDGVQLVAVEDGEPVALVGCVWSPDGRERHGITDIAVSPRHRRSGLGRRAAAAVTGWAGHPSGGGWMAFVDPENENAFAFFHALGWTFRGLDDSMYRFEMD